MKIACLQFNPIQENTYVVWDDTLEAVVIDAGNSNPREDAALDNFIAEHGLRPVLAANTHGHFDHTLGVAHLKKRYGIPFAMSLKDAFLLDNASTSGSIFGVPSSGQSMAINASLSQTLEMKVLSKRDTSGMKKIKLIDELRIGQVSYNFLADSMGLSNIPISLRTTVFQNFGINISATLDPYRVTPQGQRINKLFFPGRVVSASTSFGYTFQSRQDNSTPAINDINSAPIDPAYANPFYDPYGQMNPALRRQYMTQAYYDFSLPWNLGFNYTISYSSSPTNNGTTGYQKNITQTLGINGSVTILPKMGVTFQGGYDFQAKELTPASITITRDLHCWQMSFAWIPFGHYQSWSFNIGVKAASLADLKYDKSQSMFDNLY